jgi:Xaa-Pro aminopeptidase
MPLTIRGRSLPLSTYRRRRASAAKILGKAHGPTPILLLGAPADDPVLDRTPVAGRHRQDPWFDWFTGCHEGDAALLIDPSGSQRDTLFLEKGDPDRIVWDGERLGPGTVAKRAFGVHATAPLGELKERLQAAIDRAGGRIAMFWRKREPGHQSAAAAAWRRRLRGVDMINAEPDLVPLRMIKDADEVALHRKAIAITAAGLKATMPLIPRMKSESALAAELMKHYCGPAYEPMAFAPIVGSAVNGATLHYKYNDGPLIPKAPVLIDSGATAGGYCADVTRTLPQHGRFDSARFREVYELVLRCNALGRKHARPGISLKELNEIAWAPIIDAGFTRHHGLSHHIGLDVHDPADYERPFASGMIISNEPGVYLPEEGFGIRIEDDLLITDDGCDELTKAIPKTVSAIERAMR